MKRANCTNHPDRRSITSIELPPPPHRPADTPAREIHLCVECNRTLDHYVASHHAQGRTK